MTHATSNVHEERVRYLSVEEGFNIKRPDLDPCVFIGELERAFDPATSTGFVTLDQSDRLQTEFPARLPLVLACYLRIRPGESIVTRLKASGEIYVVLAGSGETERDQDLIDWHAGDIFVMPGGIETVHRAATGDCVLYVVTNEPLLAFERLEPPACGNAPVAATHYTAAELREHLERLCARPMFDDTAGRALNLSSASMENSRTCLPSLTLTFNAVLPGESQRPHRHNAGALVLVLRQGGCHSVIDGKRFDWRDNAVVLTPPQAVHSHRNDGGEFALALIVQDGGLYYHCRTMGFAFA